MDQTRGDGKLTKVVDASRTRVRQAAGREDTPSAICIDSQTAKSTEDRAAVANDLLRQQVSQSRAQRLASGTAAGVKG